MPEAMRPPGARDALAPIQFAYDLEDEAEGVRIWGGDPYDATGWEVGQTFFERWWFIFDRDVVAQSNRLREIRGRCAAALEGAAGRGAGRSIYREYSCRPAAFSCQPATGRTPTLEEP
ncbi:conserved hypothetical protein [Verticillium alfalfae VaMs.102]|uniref:Uncharacterized protein n=1 Tax=Verticillium alfalfae (strain VaMs.102 / ATCC MYA-4576 / FGSC 10136) TaxID=526221 RepID=C9S7I5_VERA1|nr:conserved hypothetical protein [Verticillium alfalfae VaMs.102]EEY14746.1 conserved hypothetical protein [Verticillium alfalfae VaMs.102]